MKTLMIISAVVTSLLVFQTGTLAASAKSERNKQNAQTYCQQQTAAGMECRVRKTSGCGKGWKKAKKFRDGGNAWYACTRSKYGQASVDNFQECKKWCVDNKLICADCSTKPGCGHGYESIKSFTGKGKNAYACDPFYEANHKRCSDWCDTHSECGKCEAYKGCGFGYKSIKEFDNNKLAPSIIVAIDKLLNNLLLPYTPEKIWDRTRWHACQKRR